ncbi:hypothetical protein DOT_1185 [Desulfosporosinus sp. OT]|nr:hypothetical protein DOT_1185 [Desulfosporosinus sp. OT]
MPNIADLIVLNFSFVCALAQEEKSTSIHSVFDSPDKLLSFLSEVSVLLRLTAFTAFNENKISSFSSGANL